MTKALTTGHVGMAVALPPELDIRAGAACAASLPGGWSIHRTIGAEAARRSPALAVELGDDPGIEVDPATETIRLRLTRCAAESATLAYATYTAMERYRQQQRALTLHANGMVTPDGRGVLILGTKGAGKTSTSLALGERGWIHAGDDLVVIAEDENELSLLPGKQVAALRQADPVLWQFPKPTTALTPFVDGAVPLAAVVRLTLHPTVATPGTVPAVPFSKNERLRLHEAFARYLSGLPTPLTAPDAPAYGPVWPLDSPELARWRTHLIARLEQHPYHYAYAPDAQSAADLIAKEVL